MADYRESGRTLQDIQTRYKTFQELREVWQLGLEACSRVLPQYRSKADAVMISGLTAALDLLDHQIDLMSSFDMKKFQIGRVVDAIPAADKIPDTARESERRKNQNANVPDRPNPPEAGQPSIGTFFQDRPTES